MVSELLELGENVRSPPPVRARVSLPCVCVCVGGTAAVATPERAHVHTRADHHKTQPVAGGREEKEEEKEDQSPALPPLLGGPAENPLTTRTPTHPEPGLPSNQRTCQDGA